MDRRARSTVLAFAMLAMLASAVPSRAAVNLVVAVGQLGGTSYIAGVVVSAAPAFFVNADALAVHDVVSDERASGKSWCGPGKRFPTSRCPAFYSDTHGLNDPNPAPRQIFGIESLDPGTYTFFCDLHPLMVGSLQVVA